MKKKNLIFTIAASFILACNAPSNKNEEPKTRSATASSTYVHFVPIDSANKMLNSYLMSIHAAQSDSALRSVVFDATELRDYLNEITGEGKISQVKIMLAHKLSFINEGGSNQYVGYKKNALTLIIAGFNASGDHVYFNSDKVMNTGAPCPSNCPPGEAGNSLLPLPL